MAQVTAKCNISLTSKITLELTIDEARALETITKYGVDSFLQGYYKQLGKSYLQPHEEGVRSLFKTIKESLPYAIKDIDDMYSSINKIEGLNFKYYAKQKENQQGK